MRRSWPGPQRKPCVGLHHRRGQGYWRVARRIMRRPAPSVALRVVAGADRGMAPSDGSGQWTLTAVAGHMDSERMRSALVCPEDKRLSERFCRVLANPFPGLGWVFGGSSCLARVTHGWPECPLSVVLGWPRVTRRPPSVVRSGRKCTRSGVRMAGRGRQLHPCIGAPPRIVMTFRGLVKGDGRRRRGGLPDQVRIRSRGNPSEARSCPAKAARATACAPAGVAGVAMS
jgi:hypothetical protein